MAELWAGQVPVKEPVPSARLQRPDPLSARDAETRRFRFEGTRLWCISEDNPHGTRLISDGPFSLSPPVALPSSSPSTHPIARRAQYVPHRTLRFPFHTSHHLGACLVPTFLAIDLIGRYSRDPGYTHDKDLTFCAESACFEIRPVLPCGPAASRTLAQIQRRRRRGRVVVRPFPDPVARCLAGYPCLLQGGLVGVGYQQGNTRIPSPRLHLGSPGDKSRRLLCATDINNRIL